MRKSLQAGLLLILMQALPGSAAETEDARACNQLGREIALRAAEELPLSMNAELRNRLAGIAEETCASYLVPDYQDAEPEQTRRESFDLQLIEPEDRVRRPGLKRR
jgi:hypothetical protein